MRLATIEQASRIDELTQSNYAVSGEVLMEAAGALSAREIEQRFIPELRLQTERPLVIVCGPGNNGADGLVVARHLHASGYKNVVVVLIAPTEKRSKLFSLQLERCEKQKIQICDALLEARAAWELLKQSRLTVDAIFGIGFRGEATGRHREAIETIRSARAPVVSLDVPSCLDANRGMASGPAIRAQLTITFGLAKPGFFISDGPASVGHVKLLAIGFPPQLRKEVARTHFAFTERQAARALPKRGATSHKTDHGHALILAGSHGMWGASVLAASAAYRTGAGYVTLASHENPAGVMAGALPEVLTATATDEKLWSEKRKWTAAGIGPGFGTGDSTLKVLENLRAIEESRVVVDADAITVAAQQNLFPLSQNWILTPHAGELSRILKNVSAKEIEGDRFNYALEASRITGGVVVLKGFRTVVAQAGKAWVILAGNNALAKAGTGDVLTGMITGLLAQGLPPLKAAMTGAYLHGRMADEWVKNGLSRSSLEAGDLREILPGLMARLAQTPFVR